MNQKVDNNKAYYSSIIAAVIGSLLCIGLYLANRSVFLDEANLIRNIYERPLTQLLLPLDYDQSAPLLFTALVKIFEPLGSNAFVYRLVPLFLVLASIWIFRSVAWRLFPSWIAVGLVAYYGCHELVMRYATECKQYGGDLFATLLLLWAAYHLPLAKGKNYLWWIAIGIVCQFLSMPSLLVLASIGLWWLVDQGLTKESIACLVKVGLAWLAAFGINYHFILEPGLSSTHMQAYHDRYFLNFNDSDQLVSNLMTYIRLLAKKTALGMGVASLLLLLGIYNLMKSNRKTIILYIFPILITAVLAAMGKYSMIERLLLFLLPILLIIVGYGFRQIGSIHNRYLKYLLLTLTMVGTLIAGSHRNGIKWFSHHPHEDIRTAILDDKLTTTAIPHLVSKLAGPTYHYYRNIEGRAFTSEYTWLKEDAKLVESINAHLKKESKLWVIISHVDNLTSTEKLIRSQYVIEDEVLSEGTFCLLVSAK